MFARFEERPVGQQGGRSQGSQQDGDLLGGAEDIRNLRRAVTRRERPPSHLRISLAAMPGLGPPE